MIQLFDQIMIPWFERKSQYRFEVLVPIRECSGIGVEIRADSVFIMKLYSAPTYKMSN